MKKTGRDGELLLSPLNHQEYRDDFIISVDVNKPFTLGGVFLKVFFLSLQFQNPYLSIYLKWSMGFC